LQKSAASDEDLMAEFQKGNSDAFNILVGRYKDRLMNFVFRYVGDYNDADDILQETFIRLYVKKEAYAPVAKFSTWLYTIAANLAKTRALRRRLWESKKGVSELAESGKPADIQADDAIRHEIIQRALNRIPAKYREVVLLCDIQELTYEEVAEAIGINIGTVKSRLNRGRSKLKELLKDIIDE